MSALMVYGDVVPNWTGTINAFDKCLPLQPAYSANSTPPLKHICHSLHVRCEREWMPCISAAV